jgi:adenine-specific DNA glycosylase
VVLSGDITQRARPAQFQAARDFVRRLGAPVLAIPGNHDHGGPGSLWHRAEFERQRQRRAPNLQVLLERRPPAGIWGGLLSLPQADDLQQAKDMAVHLGADWERMTRLAPVEHGFTHYHLTIMPVLLELGGGTARLAREAPYEWLTLIEAPEAGVPAPIRKLLSALQAPDLFN